jgi:hypothetical protein
MWACRWRVGICGADGWSLVECAVRPVGVVVRDVGTQDYGEAAAEMRIRSVHSRRTVPIQHSAMELARGASTGVWMIVICSEVNIVSKPATYLVSRSRIRNRSWSTRSPRSMTKLRACWVTQDPVG